MNHYLIREESVSAKVHSVYHALSKAVAEMQVYDRAASPGLAWWVLSTARELNPGQAIDRPGR